MYKCTEYMQYSVVGFRTDWLAHGWIDDRVEKVSDGSPLSTLSIWMAKVSRDDKKTWEINVVVFILFSILYFIFFKTSSSKKSLFILKTKLN